jgi:hypothetical protein
MATRKKKVGVYTGAEIHLECGMGAHLIRTSFPEKTIITCPSCNFVHVSYKGEKQEKESEMKKA